MPKLVSTSRVARRLLLGLGLGGGVVLLATSGLTWADAPVEVKIDNFTFSPVPLQVKQGQEVTWVNRDDIPHSVVLADLSVHSHALDTDESFAFRFEKAGVYDYICGLHPHMHGQVVVIP
jgi:plastocyanin